VIIAVDGPTASGKGTVARALAARFGLPHLDTGLLYRAVARQVMLGGGDPDDPADAASATAFPPALLDDPMLRSEEVGGLASRVSIHPPVRAALLSRQQAFAAQPGGAVLDGRDIGTVIVPHADVKLYVTATIEARARRRFLEMRKRGATRSEADISADLALRDARDRDRAASPLRPASDALVLDNSAMTSAESVAAAIEIVLKRLSSARSR
jgi:cytidylate kinase